MSDIPTKTVLRLAVDEVVDIPDGKGLSLEILSGAIWITQARDGRDIILKPGEAFTLDRRGVAVVSALAPATVSLTARSERPPQIVRQSGSPHGLPSGIPSCAAWPSKAVRNLEKCHELS